jgi:cathepsin D
MNGSYYGSVAIGTPAIAYNVILDTGSSYVFLFSSCWIFYSPLCRDLWLADAECLTGCSGIPTFDAGGSSTFVNLSTAFQIVYGSGQAVGTLGQDVVQMAGFSVSNQVFATCDLVSSGLLSTPVSGLMGLAFQTIAASKATPFWQTLVSSGAWDEPVMAFYLSRYVRKQIS